MRGQYVGRLHTWLRSSICLSAEPVLPQVCQARNVWQHMQQRFCAAQPVEDVEDEVSPRVKSLADQVCELSLSETTDLIKILRKRLGVAPMPMAQAMPMAPMPAMAASIPGATAAPMAGAGGEAAPAAPAEEPKVEKKIFDVVIKSFDAASKIKLIKELRVLNTNLGLKEAKDLVEKAPTVLKEQLQKEEADKWKAKLEEVGAQIELE